MLIASTLASAYSILTTPPLFGPARIRAELQGALERLPGKHLVFVNDSAGKWPIQWVYNGANLEAQRVVWARPMGEPNAQRMMTHFHDRQVWFVTPGMRPRLYRP
jgi:hypothetical protein